MDVSKSLAQRYATAHLSILEKRAKISEVNKKIKDHEMLVVPKQAKPSTIQVIGKCAAVAIATVGTACLIDMGYRSVLKKTGLHNIK